MEASHAGSRFVRLEEVETQVFDWGHIRWTSEPRVTGARNFAFGVVTLNPGRGHARHNHPGVEEVLYVVAGEGEQMVEDAQGHQVRRTVRAGDTVHIPAGAYHETINRGDAAMTVVAVYSPPGPEALLRADPACRVLPPGTEP